MPPFYEKPLAVVVSNTGQSKRLPKIEVSDSCLLIHLRLVKAGYGSLSEVKKMTAREVLQALSYEKFTTDYQDAYLEMHK